MKGYVYSISTQDGVRYVGSTTNFSRRKNQHTSSFGNVKVEIIEQFDEIDRESLLEKEMFWIEQFRQWGFKLSNVAGNIQGKNTPLNRIAHVCILCNKQINSDHSWKAINGDRQHLNCDSPSAPSSFSRLYVYPPDDLFNLIKDKSKENKVSISYVALGLLKEGLRLIKGRKSFKSLYKTIQ